MRALTLSAAVLVAAACAHATSAPVDGARTDLETARRGPAGTHAPQELAMAGRTLARASAELEQRGDSARVRDLAYVASRQVDLANAKARTEQLRQRRVALTAQTAALQPAPAAEPELEVAEAPPPVPEPVRVAAAPEPVEAPAPREALGVFAQTREEPRGTVLTIPVALLFEPGADGISANGLPRLAGVAEVLKQSEGPVTVEVHTDNIGTSANNQKLADQRANVIREQLVSLGVKAERLEARGVGDEKPVVDNDTVEHRATNRRVEIVIARETKPVS